MSALFDVRFAHAMATMTHYRGQSRADMEVAAKAMSTATGISRKQLARVLAVEADGGGYCPQWNTYLHWVSGDADPPASPAENTCAWRWAANIAAQKGGTA